MFLTSLFPLDLGVAALAFPSWLSRHRSRSVGQQKAATASGDAIVKPAHVLWSTVERWYQFGFACDEYLKRAPNPQKE